MFYPKNQESNLSNELFEHPTSEYRAMPFWAWNCKLDPDDFCWQIEQFQKMGFGGFYMHPRTGLDTEYLGTEFMNTVQTCVEKAESLGMYACLYDEDRYSSGFAGGLVTINPKYRQRKLLFTQQPKETETSREKAEAEGGRYLVAIYDIVLNRNMELVSYHMVRENEPCRGEKWYAYSEVVGQPGGWFNHGTYVDAFSKEAIDKFIEITHETYQKAVGDQFGKTVPTIFTDELWYSTWTPLESSDGGCEASIPWSNDMEACFRREQGFEITERLPEALWELPDGKISVFRYQFHDFLTRLFDKVFIQNMESWCENHGILLTGHMYGEENLASQIAKNGEEMPHYRAFGIPGMDMFGNDYFYTCAKQVQSIVHQDGKEGMLSELYGVTNWDFDFRGHKCQGDWQAALGVTCRVPHLSFASMKGNAKRDYPASISYQSPWYTQYSYLEDHYARVNTALTRGKPVVKIGVIHPVESGWMYYGPNDKTLEHRKGLDDVFHHVCEWLLQGQIDFDYLCESQLPDQVNLISDCLGMGEMKYEAVVVAGCETLRSSTLDILERFHQNGGKIIFAGKPPRYENAVPSERPKVLYDACKSVQLDSCSLLEALEEERMIRITDPDGGLSHRYLYQLRKDQNCLWLFITNMRRLDKEHKNYVEGRKQTIQIKGKYTPLLYDTLSGNIGKIDFEIRNGNTYIEYTFYQSSSLLLRLNPPTEESWHSAPVLQKQIKTELVLDRVAYHRTEPNVLLFDGGEYRVDDGAYRPYEDIRKLYRNCMEELGYPITCMQPWAREKEACIGHTVSLRFSFQSEMELEGAMLACENGDSAAVWLNGEPIAMIPKGYFTDKSIKTYELPAIRKGENVIEVKMPFGKDSEIENYFVLGEFRVRLEGIHKTIYETSDRIGFGDVTAQGMPFYGGSLIYRMDVEVPENEGMEITLNSFAGPVVEVLLDGASKGRIAFSPYRVSMEAVPPGVHRLELVLYGNRYNSFAPLHTVSFEEVFVGPEWWAFSLGEPCAFKYEYELRRFGIIGSPKLTFYH